MTFYIHLAILPLWCICYCVAPAKSSLKLLAQIAASLHAILAVVALLWG